MEAAFKYEGFGEPDDDAETTITTSTTATRRVRLLKPYQVTLNIGAAFAFAADPERVLSLLQRTWEGRCYCGAYIARIVEVQRLGHIVVGEPSTIDVEFLAEVVTYSKWDILVGVQYEGNLRGRHKDVAAVAFRRMPGLEAIAPGSLVPVRIHVAEHKAMARPVLVAYLLTADGAAAVFRLSGTLNLRDTPQGATARRLLRAIHSELQFRAAMTPEAFSRLLTFEEMLYAYARPKAAGAATTEIEAWPDVQWTGRAPIDGGAHDAVSFPALVHDALHGTPVDVTGVWSRALWIPRSSPHVVRVREPLPGWDPAVERDAPSVFVEFLKNMHSTLVAVREMHACYEDPAVEKANAGVFAAMRMHQRQLPK